jgi:hypothetical protein
LQANPNPSNGIFGNKRFNVPSLVEMADSLPAFHNNLTMLPSGALPNTVEGAVSFYNTAEFAASPAGQQFHFNLSTDDIAHIGHLLRAINALQNVDDSSGSAQRARDLLQDPNFDPAAVNSRLDLAIADANDGSRVLGEVGMNPNAKSLFDQAKQQFESAKTGTAAARIAFIDAGLADLTAAHDDIL